MSKNRTLADIISNNTSKIKSIYTDSDSVLNKTTLGLTIAAGTATYSSTDLLPGSASDGDQALVTDTNRLYIYSGSGWYNIALINNTPYWVTEASSSYQLNKNGTSTVITILAVDSDGTQPEYIAAADSDFTQMATITKDSDNGRVFIVTPIDSESGTSLAGSGTVTFKASDGVNLATTLSTFNITFAIPNSADTTLLIQAQSGITSQQDTSGNLNVITSHGNATSDALTPYHPGGYSLYFDGTGDYLTVPNDAGFNFGSDDFTVECWACPFSTVSGSSHAIVSFYDAGNNRRCWQIQRNGTGNDFRFYYSTDGTTPLNLAHGTNIYVSTGLREQWTHLAVVRNSNTLTLYVNGTSVDSASITGSLNSNATDPLVVGGAISSGTAGSYYYGYVRDLRIVKGTAVYTSAFTPPTRTLTAINNTSFLTGHLPYFADGSSNNHAITINGGADLRRFGPYDYPSYKKAAHGGSIDLDGTGDYLSIPANTGFDLDSDFTIEAWITTYDTTRNMLIVDTYVSGDNNSYQFYFRGTGNSLAFYTVGDGVILQDPSSTTITNGGDWFHVAVTRSGSTCRMFINGKQVDSTTNSRDLTHGNILSIGAQRTTGTNYYDGRISDLRIVKGTAVYTSNFTPPATPLTAISGTSLLTGTNKLNIWDAGSSDFWGGRLYTRLYGNVASNSITRKWNTSDSIYFDGSGDYIRVDQYLDRFNGTSSPVTIEGWAYSQANPSTFETFFGMNRSSDGNNQLLFGVESSQWKVYWSGSQVFLGSSFSVNTWYHIALVLNDGTKKLRVYINGTSIYEVNTTLLDATPSACNAAFGCEFDAANGGTPGNYWQGFMQDLRISNGARYTANFTPPTEQFEG